MAVSDNNERIFFQSHEIAGCRAKVTIEWSWPEDAEPPQNWQNMAEEIAEEAFAGAGPKSHDIARALRGNSGTR